MPWLPAVAAVAGTVASTASQAASKSPAQVSDPSKGPSLGVPYAALQPQASEGGIPQMPALGSAPQQPQIGDSARLGADTSVMPGVQDISTPRKPGDEASLGANTNVQATSAQQSDSSQAAPEGQPSASPAGRTGSSGNFLGLSGEQWQGVGQATGILAKLFEAHRPDVVSAGPLPTANIPYHELGPQVGQLYHAPGLSGFGISPPNPATGASPSTILDELKRLRS